MSFKLNDIVRIIDIDAVGTIVKILDNCNYAVTYYDRTNLEIITSESNLEIKSGVDLEEFEMGKTVESRLRNKIHV